MYTSKDQKQRQTKITTDFSVIQIRTLDNTKTKGYKNSYSGNELADGYGRSQRMQKIRNDGTNHHDKAEADVKEDQFKLH